MTEETEAQTNLAAVIRATSRPLQPRPTYTAPHIARISGIKAVIIDVYGTVFISGSGDISIVQDTAATDVFVTALRKAGFTSVGPNTGEAASDLYHAAIRASHERSTAHGVDVPEVDIRDIWAEVLDSLRRGKLIRTPGDTVSEAQDGLAPPERVAVWYEALSNPTWPMPRACHTIRELHRRGVPLGIVSNAQFYTPALFTAHFNAPYVDLGFDKQLCSWSFHAGTAKPSPVLFQPVLNALQSDHGISPAEAVYVGNDMLNDVFAADSCGMKTVLFAGDARSLRLRKDKQQCSGLSPSATITDWSQLLQVIA